MMYHMKIRKTHIWLTYSMLSSVFYYIEQNVSLNVGHNGEEGNKEGTWFCYYRNKEVMENKETSSSKLFFDLIII